MNHTQAQVRVVVQQWSFSVCDKLWQVIGLVVTKPLRHSHIVLLSLLNQTTGKGKGKEEQAQGQKAQTKCIGLPLGSCYRA